MPRQDAQLIHQVGEPVGKGSCLPRPCPGNDPYIAFRRSDCLFLLFIQLIP